jgi:hypothetical protein
MTCLYLHYKRKLSDVRGTDRNQEILQIFCSIKGKATELLQSTSLWEGISLWDWSSTVKLYYNERGYNEFMATAAK